MRYPHVPHKCGCVPHQMWSGICSWCAFHLCTALSQIAHAHFNFTPRCRRPGTRAVYRYHYPFKAMHRRSIYAPLLNHVTEPPPACGSPLSGLLSVFTVSRHRYTYNILIAGLLKRPLLLLGPLPWHRAVHTRQSFVVGCCRPYTCLAYGFGRFYSTLLHCIPRTYGARRTSHVPARAVYIYVHFRRVIYISTCIYLYEYCCVAPGDHCCLVAPHGVRAPVRAGALRARVPVQYPGLTNISGVCRHIAVWQFP